MATEAAMKLPSQTSIKPATKRKTAPSGRSNASAGSGPAGAWRSTPRSLASSRAEASGRACSEAKDHRRQRRASAWAASRADTAARTASSATVRP